MKKVIILSVLAVVTVLAANTSAKAQKGIYIGAQGARHISVMFNENDVDNPGSDYKSRFSGSVGLSGGYNFNRHFGVGTEVMYSTAKQRYIDHSGSYTQRFNYLKIPVLFTYNTNPDRKLQFIAKAGPQLGIMLNSKISGSTTGLNGTATDKYRKLTIGAMVGAGARLRLTDNIFLDGGLRVDGSFSNTEKFKAGRSKTHDLNAGVELGVKYFF